jgi:hypothetical protein
MLHGLDVHWGAYRNVVLGVRWIWLSIANMMSNHQCILISTCIMNSYLVACGGGRERTDWIRDYVSRSLVESLDSR